MRFCSEDGYGEGKRREGNGREERSTCIYRHVDEERERGRVGWGGGEEGAREEGRKGRREEGILQCHNINFKADEPPVNSLHIS